MNPEEVEELRAWLDDHPSAAPVSCLLCEELVTRQLALLVALWWFIDPDEQDEDDVVERLRGAKP